MQVKPFVHLRHFRFGCSLACTDAVGELAATVFFFFNDTATTEIYTLSLHDALPIGRPAVASLISRVYRRCIWSASSPRPAISARRSEEHTSELQSPCNLVCRLL